MHACRHSTASSRLWAILRQSLSPRNRSCPGTTRASKGSTQVRLLYSYGIAACPGNNWCNTVVLPSNNLDASRRFLRFCCATVSSPMPFTFLQSFSLISVSPFEYRCIESGLCYLTAALLQEKRVRRTRRRSRSWRSSSNAQTKTCKP